MLLIIIIPGYLYFLKDLKKRNLARWGHLFIGIFSLSTIASIFENLAVNQYQYVLFSNIEYAAIAGIGPSWFLFLYKYSVGDKHQKRKFDIPLEIGFFLFPMIIAAFLITRNFSDPRIAIRAYRVSEFNWILFALYLYTFAMYFAGFLHITTKIMESTSPKKKQIIAVAVMITILPIMSTTFDVTILPSNRYETYPVCTAVSFLIFLFGAKKFGIFYWLPISMSEIIEVLPHGLIILDREGATVTINNEASRILGIDNEKISLSEALDEISDKLSKSNEIVEGTSVIKYRGRTLKLERLLENLAGDTLQGYVFLLSDVSERNKSDEMHRFFTSVLVKNMNRLTYQITDEMNSISGYLAGLDDDQSRDASLHIAESSKQIRKIANQFDVIASLRKRNIYTSDRYDAAPFLTELLSEISENFYENGCDLTVHIPPSISMNLDQDILLSVIEGFLEGSRDLGLFKKIRLNVYQNEDGVIFDLFGEDGDTTTIPMHNVFSNVPNFSQAANDVMSTLGLAVCSVAANAVGGVFRVEPLDAKNARFTISLPFKGSGPSHGGRAERL